MNAFEGKVQETAKKAKINFKNLELNKDKLKLKTIPQKIDLKSSKLDDIFDLPELQNININQGIFKNRWFFSKAKEFPEEVQTFGTDKKLKTIKFPNFIGEVMIFHDLGYLQNNLREKNNYEIGKDEIKEYGIRRDHDLELNKQDWRWRGEYGILNFLKGNTEIVDELELYNKILKKLKSYVDVTDEGIYHLAVCYVIQSYCYELFNSVTQLQFYGEKKSGKTKIMKLINYMSYKGIIISQSTASNIFRIIENNKPSLAIDEYEEMKESENKQIIDQLLNSGNQRTVKVPRQEKDNYGKFRTKYYDVYCPKMVASISGMNSTTESRFIKITMLKAKNNDPRLNRDIETFDEEFEEIRDMCYVLIMQNWRFIQHIYNNIELPDEINGRYNDMWKPVLTIAQLCNTREVLERYALENIKQAKQDQADNTYDFLVLSTILDNIKIQRDGEGKIINKPIQESSQEMAYWLAEKEGIEDNELKKYVKKKKYSISHVLRRCKPLIKDVRTNKNRMWEYTLKDIMDILMRRDYPLPEEFEEIKKELFESDGGDIIDSKRAHREVKDNIDNESNLFKKKNIPHVTVTTVTNVRKIELNKENVVKVIEENRQEYKNGIPFGILSEKLDVTLKNELSLLEKILDDLSKVGFVYEPVMGRWKLT